MLFLSTVLHPAFRASKKSRENASLPHGQNSRPGITDHWKNDEKFFQSLEKTGGFFQPLENIGPSANWVEATGREVVLEPEMGKWIVRNQFPSEGGQPVARHEPIHPRNPLRTGASSTIIPEEPDNFPIDGKLAFRRGTDGLRGVANKRKPRVGGASEMERVKGIEPS